MVWVPGAREEIEAVQTIFQMFVRERRSEREIAGILNERRVPASNGRAWTRQSVRRLLGNERYIGNYVWNRVSTKLNAPHVRNAPDKWIRAEGAIKPIVPKPLFESARRIICERARKMTQEEKLAPLRRLLRKHGRLTWRLIKASADVPSVTEYQRSFGGLIEAYELVGFTGYRRCRRPRRPFRSKHAVTARLSKAQLLELLRRLLQIRGFLSIPLINEAEGVPSAGTYVKRFGSIKRAYRLAGFPEQPGRLHYQSSRRGSHAITQHLSNNELLAVLRELLERQGRLTQEIINKSKGVPSAVTYLNRFGSLRNAYRLIGYVHERARSTKGKGLIDRRPAERSSRS